MNKVAANLTALMEAKPVGENQLARETGVPQPTIHRIASGDSKDPRDGSLRPLAEYFKVTVEELRTAEVAALLAARASRINEGIPAYAVRPIEDHSDVDTDREVMVAEIDVHVSGGPGNWVPDFVETQYRMAYQLNWFRQVGAKPENVRLMKVHGHSMERTLFDGDRIALNLGETRVSDGRVYVLVTPGVDANIKVKRLYTTSDGRLRIVSDNPDKVQYPDEYLSTEEADQVRIIGRVVDRSGRGGL